MVAEAFGLDPQVVEEWPTWKMAEATSWLAVKAKTQQQSPKGRPARK